MSFSLLSFGKALFYTCFAFLLTPGTGYAAAPPDNIAEVVKEAEQACRHMNGIPNSEALLSVDDLNGDGGEDWIVDFAKLKCEGGINPLCGGGGCTMQIYFWDGEASWDLVFEDLVQSYKFGKDGGKPMLYVTTPGTPCNKPVAETCDYTYRLEKEAVVPVKN
ncbi:MAG: hypothetical protein MUP20_07145 [Methyloceanibacter sp.]|nr:hypothetical protein [Methyloceanibacter sp.]